MPTNTINNAFGALLLDTFNDPAKSPVHMLFNQWWQHAPEAVTQAYIDAVSAVSEVDELLTGKQYADPLDLAELAESPAGTLGRAYHDWIVDNGLQAAIATNYRHFHESLERAGLLDGMPEQLRFAVLRGFQTHDFQHVVTGYDSSGWGEIALQAFCLAQIPFPYFGMWMSVVTTRMTFADPGSIAPMMDAITHGWQLGRTVRNIQAVQWEQLLPTPLTELRTRYGIHPAGKTAHTSAEPSSA